MLIATQICSDLSPVWQVVGYVFWLLKIIIPIIIIIFGAIDLGKAVIASKDDEIKKSVKSLAFRAIAGVVIFFIPTLVGTIFSLVGEFGTEEYKAEYNICKKCVTKPTDSVCTSAVDKANS